MAKQESDREDIMREATALVDRVEITLDFLDEPLIAGFRRGGALSLFFGPDEVYQFNVQGELRRGFQDGQIIKAEHKKISRMERRRTETETLLMRTEFTPAETDAYLTRLNERLHQIKRSLDDGAFCTVQEVASDPSRSVIDLIRDWLRAADEIEIAKSPRVGS